MARMNGMAKFGGEFVHCKQKWPGIKKEIALHFSSCFVFLIIPLMHEYILIIKDFVNTEILRANPEMTSVVCFRTFTAELVPLSCV